MFRQHEIKGLWVYDRRRSGTYGNAQGQASSDMVEPYGNTQDMPVSVTLYNI